MSEMVINTVQFRFPTGSPPPSWVEIANFLKQLDTDLMLMETAYKAAQDRSLYVKFISHEAMMESLGKNTEPRQFAYKNGKSVAVRMTIAGANMQYVRVFDLQPELPDANLSLTLGEFGRIEHVIREKFPSDLGLDHMYTGIRGVYMDVEKSIPPSIDVGDRKARVFYEGLKDTCFLCLGFGHRKDVCPQRKIRNKQDKKRQVNEESCSYADVVSGKESVPEVIKDTQTCEDDLIEVLEEDDGEYIDLPEISDAERTQKRNCGTDSEK